MENTIDVTALSSKGQIVLPKTIREELSLKVGTKLMVFSDGKNILLKPIAEPDKKEFEYLMETAENWAKNVHLKESEIAEAISSIRKRRK